MADLYLRCVLPDARTDGVVLMDGPTLTLAMPDGLTYAVAFDRYDGDRCRYWWRIAVESHNVADECDDLSMVGEPDLTAALETLLTFASCTDDPARLFPNLHRAGLDLEQSATEAHMEIAQEMP